jgi:Sec23/Sec24 helical domain
VLTVNILTAYRRYCAARSTNEGQLILPESLKLLPLYVCMYFKSPQLAAGPPDARAVALAAQVRSLWSPHACDHPPPPSTPGCCSLVRSACEAADGGCRGVPAACLQQERMHAFVHACMQRPCLHAGVSDAAALCHEHQAAAAGCDGGRAGGRAQRRCHLAPTELPHGDRRLHRLGRRVSAGEQPICARPASISLLTGACILSLTGGAAHTSHTPHAH